MPGKKMRAVKRPRVYEALKAKLGKTGAAKVANAGKSHAARSRMAAKAGRSRKG